MKESKRIIMILAVVVLSAAAILAVINGSSRENTSARIVYDCKVPLMSLSTKIDIFVENEEYSTVSGNIFKLVEDPLTMRDGNGNEMARAGDDYHFIAQDSHSIIVDGVVTAEMVGLPTIVGEKYNILNSTGEQIASAKFNMSDTVGEIRDMDGNLIAEYRSGLFARKFEVRIYDSCTIDDNTILMIVSSYFSDKEFEEEQ